MTSSAPDAPDAPDAAVPAPAAPPTAVPSPAAPPTAASAPAAPPTPLPSAAVHESASAPDSGATLSTGRVTVRRAPRIGRMVVLGAGLGAITTFILTALYPVDPLVGFGALLGYFLLYGVPIGAAVGAVFAILFDVIATRRARQLDAERESVDAPDEQIEGQLED